MVAPNPKSICNGDDILMEDIGNVFVAHCVDWAQIEGRSVLVTGATGYLGSIIVRALMLKGVTVYPMVRNVEKAKALFGEIPCMVGDVREPVKPDLPIDYIIHAASVTTSKTMIDQPYETMMTTIEGTKNLLVLAREKKVRGMVYLSSMEVYGAPDPDDYEMTEAKQGYVDPLAPRSSYPLSKRAAEGLCAAAAHEYGVPVRIARLAQTFGAGIPKTENRVFAQFARAIMNGADIVLKTDGSKAHCYCYSSDAVAGLLMLLTRGIPGEAYNLSNESTFSSIREIAERLIAAHPGSKTRIVFDVTGDASSYPPSSKMKIISAKARQLGWQPTIGLEEMYERLIKSLKS